MYDNKSKNTVAKGNIMKIEKIMNFNINDINWKKVQNLIPCIIQDDNDGTVLMHGYMNVEALKVSIQTEKVTFYSRTKKRLWTKGESSKNYLNINKILLDCDNDTLLFLVTPEGNTCHLDRKSCFNYDLNGKSNFIYKLETIIENRIKNDSKNSYSNNLLKQKINRVAQKVGEEGVEVALAALSSDIEDIKEESADLIYHLLLLLRKKEIPFAEIEQVLIKRNKV